MGLGLFTGRNNTYQPHAPATAGGKRNFMRTPLFGRYKKYLQSREAAVLLTLLVVLLPAVAQAQDGADVSPRIIGQVFDKEGTSVAGGTLLFNGAVEGVHQFEVTQSGTIKFSAADFDLQETYRVSYEDSTGLIVCIMDGWQFRPEDYDQNFDSKQNVNKYNLRPVFWNTGKTHHSEKNKSAMEFNVKRYRNPWWYDSLALSLPKYFVAAQISFMFGSNWTTNEEALGGVVGNSPGFHFVGAYRFGFPQISKVGGPVIYYREISVSYAFNRYDIDQANDPGSTADVQFHRITAAYSFGRMGHNLVNHFSLGPALSVGGIYDGSTPLEYMDRSYGMIGVGAQGKFIHQVVETGWGNLGLHAQFELMHYPADRGENDFWYGLAPSFSLGVVFY